MWGKSNLFFNTLVEKNRVWHGKNTNFTCVVVTLALLGHQTSHSRNKFFSPSCTIYYFISRLVCINIYWIELNSYSNKTYTTLDKKRELREPLQTEDALCCVRNYSHIRTAAWILYTGWKTSSPIERTAVPNENL